MSLTSTTKPTRPTFARRVSRFLRNSVPKIRSQPMVRTRSVYFDNDSGHDDPHASSLQSAIQSQPMFRMITTYFGDIEEGEDEDEDGDEDLVFARPASIQFGSRHRLSAHLGQYDVSVTLPAITPRVFASSHDGTPPPFPRHVQSSPMVRTETVYFDDDEGSNIVKSVAMRRGGTMYPQSNEDDGNSGIYTDYLLVQPTASNWDPCHGSPASFSTISSDASHYSTSDVGPSPYLNFEQPQRELASCAAGPTSPHPASFNLPKSPLLRRFVSSVSRLTKRFTSHETEPVILSPTCALDEEDHHISML